MDNTVLTDSAYASILELILSSEIKPGERIREDVLAERFGISRTPVREAVNRLSQNGFVVNIKRKGVYCVKLTKEDLLNLLDLRMILESFSLDKCVELATAGDIAALRGLISDFHYKYNFITHNSPAPVGDIAKLHNFEDVRFHVQIAQISRSERLIRYIGEVENTLLLARQRIYRQVESADIIKLSWDQHTQMLDAVESRDLKTVHALFDMHRNLMKDTQIAFYD